MGTKDISLPKKMFFRVFSNRKGSSFIELRVGALWNQGILVVFSNTEERAVYVFPQIDGVRLSWPFDFG